MAQYGSTRNTWSYMKELDADLVIYNYFAYFELLYPSEIFKNWVNMKLYWYIEIYYFFRLVGRLRKNY